jgi:hypothetical protein
VGGRQTIDFGIMALTAFLLAGFGVPSAAWAFVSGCTRQETSVEAKAFESHCSGCHSERAVLDDLRDREPADPRAWLRGFLSGHVLCPPEVYGQVADYLADKLGSADRQ